MIMRRLSSIVLLICSTAYGSGQTGAHKNDAVLDKKLEIPAIQEVTTEHAIAVILSAAGIPGGIVEVGSCSGEGRQASRKQSLSFAGLTVRQALDLIIANDPRYKWVVQDKTINVVPSDGIPEALTTKLGHFEMDQRASSVDFEAKLFGTPELKSYFLQHGYVEEDRLRAIVGPGKLQLAHPIRLDNATVLDVLNAAADSYQTPAVWRFVDRRGSCQKTYLLEWPVL
jgi:hypothetical protein